MSLRRDVGRIASVRGSIEGPESLRRITLRLKRNGEVLKEIQLSQESFHVRYDWDPAQPADIDFLAVGAHGRTFRLRQRDADLGVVQLSGALTYGGTVQSEDGTPMEGARVALLPTYGYSKYPLGESPPTDSSGKFALSLFESQVLEIRSGALSRYELYVRSGSSSVGPYKIIPAGFEGKHTISVPADSLQEAQIRVETADGDPVPGVSVALSDAVVAEHRFHAPLSFAVGTSDDLGRVSFYWPPWRAFAIAEVNVPSNGTVYFPVSRSEAIEDAARIILDRESFRTIAVDLEWDIDKTAAAGIDVALLAGTSLGGGGYPIHFHGRTDTQGRAEWKIGLGGGMKFHDHALRCLYKRRGIPIVEQFETPGRFQLQGQRLESKFQLRGVHDRPSAFFVARLRGANGVLTGGSMVFMNGDKPVVEGWFNAFGEYGTGTGYSDWICVTPRLLKADSPRLKDCTTAVVYVNVGGGRPLPVEIPMTKLREVVRAQDVLELELPVARASGRCRVLSEDGTPAIGAMVTVFESRSTVGSLSRTRVATDSNGEAYLAGLQDDGVYRVVAFDRKTSAAAEQRDWRPREHTLELTLRKSSAVRIRLQYPDRTPVLRATILLATKPFGILPRLRGRHIGDGVYEIPACSHEVYNLQMSAVDPRLRKPGVPMVKSHEHIGLATELEDGRTFTLPRYRLER
ncbi:MAG: hypothetical protein AAGD14_04845 [Planctomycetota bacterium]